MAAVVDFKSSAPISEALVTLFPGKDVTKWERQLAALDIETVEDVRSITDEIWKTMPGLSPVLLSGLGAIRNKKQLVPVGLEHLSRSRNSEFPSLSSDLTFLNLQAQFRAVRQYQSMMVQQERHFVKQIRDVTADFQKKTQDALLLRSLLTEVDDTALQSYYHFLDGNTTDEQIVNPQTLGAETESLVNQYAQFVQFLREQPRVMALLGPLGGQTQKPWPGQGPPSKRKSFAEIVCYGVYGSAYQALDSRHLVRALGLILSQELAVHRSRSLGDEAKGDRNVKALRLLGESESANAPSSGIYAQSFAVKMALLTFNRFALELCSPFFSPFVHTVCRMDVELEPGSNKEEAKAAAPVRGDIPNTPSQKTAVLKKFVKGRLAKPGATAVKKSAQQATAPVRSKDQLQTELTKYCDLLFDAFIKATHRWPVIVLQTLGVLIRECLRQWPHMRRAHVVFHVFYSQFVLPVLSVDASWAPPTLFPVYMNSTQTNNIRVVMQVVTTILEAAAFKDSGQPERSNKAWGDIANSLRLVAKDYITSKVPVVSEHLTNLANLALKAANAKHSAPVSMKERVFQLGLSIEDVILLRDTLLKHLEEVPLSDTSATLAGLAAAEPWLCPYCGAKDKNQNIFCMTCSLPRENGMLNLAVSYDGLRRFANLPTLAPTVSKRKVLLRVTIKDTFLDPTPVADRRPTTAEPDESLSALRFMLPDLSSQIEDIFGALEAAAPEGNEGQVYDIARCISQVFALDHWDRFEMTSNDLIGFADELHFAITTEMGAAATYLHNPTSEALWRSGSSAVAFLEDLLAWVLLGTGDKSSSLPGAEKKFEPSPMELVHSKVITSDFKRARELVRNSIDQLQRKLKATWTPREHSLASTLEVMRTGEMKLTREIEFLRGLIFHHSLLAICLDTTVQLSVRTQVMLRAPEVDDEEEEAVEKDTNTFACSSIVTLVEQYRKYRSVLETHRHIGAQLLHCFQEILEKKLSRKLKAEQLKHATELVEAYICTALFDCLFEEPHNTTRSDAMLAEKLATGAWVRPAHLGLVILPEKQMRKNVQALLGRSGAKDISEAAIKAEMDKERQTEADMLRVLWGRPCEELCGLEHSITPLRKLLCLSRTIKLIFENLKALSRRGGNFDADTCLSALIGVIIHTPPVRLMANLAYISSFRHHNKLDGEDQYCITQFNLAISFISNANFDSRAANSNSLLQRRNTIQPLPQRPRGTTRVQVESTEELMVMSPLFTVLAPQLDRFFEFLSNSSLATLALSCRLGASQCRSPLLQRSMLQSSKKSHSREDEKTDRIPPPPPPTQEGGGEQRKVGACNIPAVAKHSYDATGKQGSYLSFVKDQELTITKIKSDRWWWAVCGDQKGWVPSSYVILKGPLPEPAR